MTENKLDPARQAVLDAERAINEQYQDEIRRLLARQPGLIKQVAITQSQQWTESSLPRPEIDSTATTAIIGRVALNRDHPYSDDLGQTFYIAGWRIKNDGLETVNWAAPVASLFFEGRSSVYPIASSLRGRRTFVQRRDDLIDYSDEIEHDTSADPFKSLTRHLEIPAAPTRHSPISEPDEKRYKSTGPHPADRHETPTIEPGGQLVAASFAVDKGRFAGIRAADAVARVVQEPKRGRMGPVLPTMQPDQYRHVSAPSDRGLIVQGQPGTGKTVIALHRAIYLSSQERGSNRIARLAIIGPSEGYTEYVRPILDELSEPGATIDVFSLPDLLRSISGLSSFPIYGPISQIECSWELGRVIDKFVRAMAQRPKSGRIYPRVRQVVEALKRANESEVADAEVLAWIRALPNWNEVLAQIRYLPMLATIALALDPRPVSERFSHLIVDEAQDIRPLEWRIITTSLLEPGGSLSLFGDVNQRRSDWTALSWHQLAVDLEMTDEHGRFLVQELGKGFRSSKQILRFANQLLPRGKRNEHALQDGPKPTVLKVSPDSLITAAVDSAIELTSRHLGVVAVICAEPRPVWLEFRRRAWTRGRNQHNWTLDDATVVALRHDQARGLEFDAVVVVEPGAFPTTETLNDTTTENVGRHGVLYTSLTRANKELTVVHSQRLPRHLRPPR
ncbi:MAG: AAA family ATPase [Acidimicrobiia bacterium]|nr:AAA family ATPase [Acidimicrobiia bacterium]MCY4433219.1 AAA family ATPase [bacterium]